VPQMQNCKEDFFGAKDLLDSFSQDNTVPANPTCPGTLASTQVCLCSHALWAPQPIQHHELAVDSFPHINVMVTRAKGCMDCS
jgi:hypothetical protein